MKKQELRKTYLEKRMSLSSQEWASQSLSLCQQVGSLSKLSSAKVIHIYLSMVKNREPDTRWVLEDLDLEGRGQTLRRLLALAPGATIFWADYRAVCRRC